VKKENVWKMKGEGGGREGGRKGGRKGGREGGREGETTLSITTFSLTTLSIMVLNNNVQNATMLSVFLLSVRRKGLFCDTQHKLILLSVVILNVVAPGGRDGVREGLAN
jgi:hypothetical protein